jgi:hypothetical protein
MPKNEKLALKLGIQTYQILTNDNEVYIPSLSSILYSCTRAEGFRLFFGRIEIKAIKFNN